MFNAKISHYFLPWRFVFLMSGTCRYIVHITSELFRYFSLEQSVGPVDRPVTLTQKNTFQQNIARFYPKFNRHNSMSGCSCTLLTKVCCVLFVQRPPYLCIVACIYSMFMCMFMCMCVRYVFSFVCVGVWQWQMEAVSGLLLDWLLLCVADNSSQQLLWDFKNDL